MTSLRALLANNIKKRRKVLGISQAVLAERAGTSTHHIAQIEQQNRFPSAELLERIAEALEFNNWELFSAGPYSEKAIQRFNQGIRADIEEKLENLFMSIK